MGCCAISCVHAQAPGNPYSYWRTSSFTYNPANGLLATETVEPGNVQSCVVTTHGYDAYGNKGNALTSNCAGGTGRAVIAARAASSTFAMVSSQPIVVSGATVNVQVPAGTFADTSTNSLNQSQHSTYDPRYGGALTLLGPNGLTTTWSYDDLGRKTLEKRADGTSTVTAYCYLSSSGLDASSNSNLCSSLGFASNEVPAGAVMFVHSEPHDASASSLKNGPFMRAYMDRSGRKIRTVTEAFDGASQVGGVGRLLVQDVDYSPYGVQAIATQPYFLDSNSSTASGSNDYGMSRTDYDRLGRPTGNYVVDGKGSQVGVAFGGRGTRTASLTTVRYVALMTTTTNDLSQAKVEEKNIDGRIARVTDAMGAQLAQQYDAFGNLVATRDALQNSVTLSFDIRGRKLSMSDPDTGVWNYDYDALGELVWQQSPKELAASVATTMAYDLLGRMTQRVEPEYTSTWNYDTYAGGAACAMGVGKLCQSSTSNGITHKYSYDSLGRPQNTRTDVTSGPSFATSMQYDNVNGRVAGQVYPTGLQVSYGYTAKGFLQGVQSATALVVSPLPTTPGGSARSPGATLPAGTTLWAGMSMNAWGRFEQHRNNQQTGGSSFTTTTAFDGATGRVLTEQAGMGSSTSAMNLSYVWDSLGRVTQRTDQNGAQWVNNAGFSLSGAVTDSLAYDAVGRLQTDVVAAPGIPNLARTVEFEYNALGMLLYKSDVGVYSYPGAGTGVVRPHAVQSVAGSYAASYLYDANGNAQSASAGAWRGITYTSFNLPDGQAGVQGPSGGPAYTWLYDESHQRFKEVRTNAAGTRTTWMLHPDNVGGLNFEREEEAAGNSNRHYITAGGMTIGVIVTTASLPSLGAGMSPPAQSSLAVVKVEFWHVDRQGSLMATTDHAGAITAVYAYDPFGKRRQTTGAYDASGTLVIDWAPTVDSGTDRGYTGQEHLDDLGLIHMNGRLYDPMLGRFLQGDPFIADPNNLQDYDRFAYCMNNPVICTDPSGYLHIFGHNILPGIFHNKDIMMVVAIAAACVVGPEGAWAVFSADGMLGAAAGIANAAVAGFVSGAISSGNIKGAMQGAVTGAAFFEVGSFVGATNSAGKIAESIALHAVVGCASSEMAGGKCGPGALSAAFADGATLMPGMESINSAAAAHDPTALIEGTIIAAASGGTASVLGGGKFANGAQTGAFGYLFNHLAHGVDLTKTQGQKIVDDAANWKDTPYASAGTALAGAAASQGVGADCSGSTCVIYDQVGDPYDYTDSRRFAAAANQEGFPFRVLATNETPQVGDVILFSGHMAIYAGQDASATT